MSFTEILQHRIDQKTKPVGSLGRLEEIALKIGQVQKSLTPSLNKPTILVFAGDHGITEEGISLYPKEVTHQMVMNFVQGGAAINIFCRQHGIELKVVDAGVDYDFPELPGLIQAKVARGSRNILREPALEEATCRSALERGRELVEKEFRSGCNVIGFGEMGIGNTSSAALIMHKITGISIEECTGRGTGFDDRGLERKKEVLKQASRKYRVHNPMEILSTYGGLEIAMMCGAMLQAKDKGMLLLVDGFISTAAFLVVHAMDPSMLNVSIFCHASAETGHSKMLSYLGVRPVADLGMRLGEGTGVAVVYPILVSAIKFLDEMASFEEAGVSNKE